MKNKFPGGIDNHRGVCEYSVVGNGNATANAAPDNTGGNTMNLNTNTTAPASPSLPSPEHVARLREVFEMVQNAENWKLPINADVPRTAATEAEITEAVVFFAGCVPVVVASTLTYGANSTRTWWVRAVGYYEAVGM